MRPPKAMGGAPMALIGVGGIATCMGAFACACAWAEAEAKWAGPRTAERRALGPACQMTRWRLVDA